MKETIILPFKGCILEAEVIKRYGSIVFFWCQDRIAAIDMLDMSNSLTTLVDCLDVAADLSNPYPLE